MARDHFRSQSAPGLHCTVALRLACGGAQEQEDNATIVTKSTGFVNPPINSLPSNLPIACNSAAPLFEPERCSLYQLEE